MNKYANLIWSGILAVAAIVVIIWIMRESTETVEGAVSNVPVSPDEMHEEKLNGIAPLNEQVDTAQTNLTYNVPQPGVVSPVSDTQDSLTMGQAFLYASPSADESVSNLLAVNLPAQDFTTDISQYN